MRTPASAVPRPATVAMPNGSPYTRGERLGRELMPLHEGSLVAYGLTVFPGALELATGRARALLRAATA